MNPAPANSGPSLKIWPADPSGEANLKDSVLSVFRIAATGVRFVRVCLIRQLFHYVLQEYKGMSELGPDGLLHPIPGNPPCNLASLKHNCVQESQWPDEVKPAAQDRQRQVSAPNRAA